MGKQSDYKIIPYRNNMGQIGDVTRYWAKLYVTDIYVSGTIDAPGSDTEIIFNDGGSLGADAGLTYNNSTNVLFLDGDIEATNISATGIIDITDDEGYLSIGRVDNVNYGGKIQFGSPAAYSDWTIDLYDNDMRAYTNSANDALFKISNDGAGEGSLKVGHNIASGGTIFVGSDADAPTALGQLHVDQQSAAGAIPVLYLDQADISEEMIEFATTIGTGNAIEAVAAKTLTTTHFIKVTIPGALTRYIPCGTIA